jgi:hypothetical protein
MRFVSHVVAENDIAAVQSETARIWPILRHGAHLLRQIRTEALSKKAGKIRYIFG